MAARPIDRLARALVLALGGVLSGHAEAGVTAYTTRLAFDSALAALPGLATVTENYDAHAPGTTIADGTSRGGLTYSYGNAGNDLAGSGVSIQVSTGFGTTSPANYLGTSDGGIFQGGDDFTLSFGPARALGMYFISNDPLFDGDITLGTGIVTAALATADEMAFALPDGKVFFLGLIDDSASFSSAEIRSSCAPCGAFLFNIDDVVIAQQVPVPATLPLAVTALGLVGLQRWRLRSRHREDQGGARRRVSAPAGPSAAAPPWPGSP